MTSTDFHSIPSPRTDQVAFDLSCDEAIDSEHGEFTFASHSQRLEKELSLLHTSVVEFRSQLLARYPNLSIPVPAVDIFTLANDLFTPALNPPQ